MFSVHTSKSMASLLSTRLLSGCVLVLKLALLPAALDGNLAGLLMMPGAVGAAAKFSCLLECQKICCPCLKEETSARHGCGAVCAWCGGGLALCWLLTVLGVLSVGMVWVVVWNDSSFWVAGCADFCNCGHMCGHWDDTFHMDYVIP